MTDAQRGARFTAAASPVPRDRSRQIARISGDYFFRTLALLGQAHEGDLTRAIVHFAIANANTAHIEEAELGQTFAAIDAPLPDDLRRPVSVMSLSQMIGMPFETTRRHVNQLIATGHCRRVQGGVIATQSDAATPSMVRLAIDNARNVRRFVVALRRAGLSFE